ncbi:MAG: helix-turn-helix domain-containing protein [Phascolarctobacterium sp.]
MELKDFIRNYRIEHGLSMEQFAKLSSLSKGYISMLEKGQNPQTKKKIIPSLTALNNIAQAMNMDLNYLLETMDDLEVSLIPDQPATTATTAKAIDFSDREVLLIKKYRQLDADGKALVDSIIDTRLMQLGGKAEEKEEALG